MHSIPGISLQRWQSDMKMDTFSPPITQSYYRHLLCHSVTGGFASDPYSWRQLDHRDVNCWPWQEQPFSCSAKMRKNCCWHGLLIDCICFQAMGNISVKKSINNLPDVTLNSHESFFLLTTPSPIVCVGGTCKNKRLVLIMILLWVRA